jgi:hypothetical protein
MGLLAAAILGFVGAYCLQAKLNLGELAALVVLALGCVAWCWKLDRRQK